MESDKIKQIRKIFEDYKLELLILFGSYETKNFNKKSDLDLAVKVKDVTNLKKDQFAILNKISNIFNQIPIDLVLLNHADPLIKFKIASEGRLLYQSQKNLFNKFKVKAASEHNDARKFYQLEKEFIEKFLERSTKNDRSSISAPKIK